MLRRRGLVAAATLALVAAASVGPAHGERAQRGQVIVSLDGGISPRRLPRSRLAPVSVWLDGAMRTTDGSRLPRVTKVELGLPSQGVISSRGLPTCSVRRLLNTKPFEARELCGGAQVGDGSLEANVELPGQRPFTIHARLLLFNGRAAGGRPAVLLHAYAANPPTVVVVPFVIQHRAGPFGTALVAELPRALGPWPRLARFEMTIWRRYAYRGRRRSFLSASCPIPPRFTAGFLSLARSTYTLADGRRLEVEIVRGCRAPH